MANTRPSVRRVLTAIDPSGGGELCLETADRFARAFGASLAVAQVLHEPFGEAGASIHAKVVEREELSEVEVARRALVKLVEATRRPAEDVATFVVRGDPARSIAELAERESADLLVLGTHGRHGAQRLLLGSVAEAVVRSASCPVLVTRASSPALGPVLAACDLERTTAPVLGLAAAVAQRFDRRLVAFHSIQPNMGDVMVMATAIFSGAVPAQPDRPTVDAMKETALAALKVELDAAGVAAEAEIDEGAAAQVTLDRARSTGASLIVLGTRGRRAPLSWVLGSVAERIVRDADCDVLVAR